MASDTREMGLHTAHPCPWCGAKRSGRTARHETVRVTEGYDFWRVQCWCCMACGPIADSREKAVQRWEGSIDPAPASD